MISLQLVLVLFSGFAHSHVNIHHRDSRVGIVGGHRVSIEQVPYMVSLRLNGTHHWCGGSIIHEQFVMTAAHCIIHNLEYKVLVGTDIVDKGGKLSNVSRIIIHENYSKNTDDYDICIIKLTEPLTFGHKVDKVTLPLKEIKVKKGTAVEVTGWGNTRPNGTISNDLLQVKIPIIPNRSCQMSYFAALRHITPRMLCAGGDGKDSCQGDSGGPLTLNDVQIGIASFGIGCGTLPGVYTKVSALLPWIKDTIEHNL